MSVLTDKDVQDIMNGEAVGVFASTKSPGYDSPLIDFPAEDYFTGYDRGYRAGWRDAVGEVLRIIEELECSPPVSVTEWGEGFDSGLEAVEHRVLPLKDGKE